MRNCNGSMTDWKVCKIHVCSRDHKFSCTVCGQLQLDIAQIGDLLLHNVFYKLSSLGNRSAKDNIIQENCPLLSVLADSRHATVRVGKSALSGKVINLQHFFYFLRVCIPFPDQWEMHSFEFITAKKKHVIIT